LLKPAPLRRGSLVEVLHPEDLPISLGPGNSWRRTGHLLPWSETIRPALRSPLLCRSGVFNQARSWHELNTMSTHSSKDSPRPGALETIGIRPRNTHIRPSL